MTVRCPVFLRMVALCGMVSAMTGCTADAPPLENCEIGFHAEGLACVANVEGDECAGVTCSGHGACIVVSSEPDYPLCLCHKGYHAQRQTNCLPDQGAPSGGCGSTGGGAGGEFGESDVCPPTSDCPAPDVSDVCPPTSDCPNPDTGPSEGCLSSRDCGGDEVCQLESGLCVAKTPDICTKDTTSNGTGFVGQSCSASQCAAGLVCVHQTLVMNAETGEWEPAGSATGRCAEACNPCEDTCSEGDCIARLHGDGGFCTRQPLLREGEICSLEAWAVGWCEAGTICARDMRWTGSRFGRGHASSCQRPCTPDRPESWEDAYFWQALASADCPSGQLCTLRRDSTAGRTFLCVPGNAQPIGEPCSDFLHPEDSCVYPLTCTNNNIPPIIVPGTCNHQDGVDCASPSACPAGTFCRFGDNPDLDDACIAPGAVRYNGHCEVDEDCASGLHCASDRPVICDHGNKCCVP